MRRDQGKYKLIIMRAKIILLFLVFIPLMAFQGCSSSNDDNGESEPITSLDGSWQGSMGITIPYGGEIYETRYSLVNFIGDPLKQKEGEGYWVDYYKTFGWGTHSYIAYHISWKVEDNLKIYFKESYDSAQIENYKIKDNVFHGTFVKDGKFNTFQLTKDNKSEDFSSLDYDYPNSRPQWWEDPNINHDDSE